MRIDPKGGWKAYTEFPHESRNVDFKSGCGWRAMDAKAKAELSRDVAALANTGGGYLLIGFEPKSLKVDGKVPPDHGFDPTCIGDFVNSRFQPPISLTVHLDYLGGCDIIVIAVQDFDLQPHICVKDFNGVLRRSDLYIRTLDAKTARVTDPADMRRLVEDAARKTRARAEYIAGSGGIELQPVRPFEDEFYKRAAVDRKTKWEAASGS